MILRKEAALFAAQLPGSRIGRSPACAVELCGMTRCCVIPTKAAHPSPKLRRALVVSSSEVCRSRTGIQRGKGAFHLMIALMMLLTITIVQPATADELFTQKKWADALTAYEQEYDPSVAVLQRMGQCAAQSGQAGKAVWYWARARKQLSWSGYLMMTRLMRSVQQQSGVVRNTHPAYEIISNGLCAVPLLWWQLLFLLLWAVMLWRGMRLYRSGRFGWLGTLLACIVLVSVITFHCWSVRTQVVGIAFKAVPLATGPHERYTRIATVTPTQDMVVEKSVQKGSERFLKVAIGHTRGWITAAQVGIC